MEITTFDLAQRFVGISEGPASATKPQVLAMLRLDQKWPKGDDVPWCSAFINYIAWLLRLPRSKSLLARSWLLIDGNQSDAVNVKPCSARRILGIRRLV
jgi:hypothetical protein